MLPEDVFPYPSFRQGQRELAQSVFLTCKDGGSLVAEAMSGFGKTAAVLAGSIAAAEDDTQIIYACRTKRQVFRVLEELNLFAGRHPLRAASLFSKYDYCLQRQRSSGVSPETFKWYCSFQTSNNLCSFFMNVQFNLAKVERLVDAQTSRPGPVSELLSKGAELHVCPYEVARLAVGSSKIIVTTYHYLLDENSRSILLPPGKPLSKVIAVIDEAHNVREFVSGSSTRKLSFSEVKDCVDESKRLYLSRIQSALSEVSDRMVKFCSQDDGWLVKKDAFVEAITGDHQKDWLADLVFELTTNSGVAWYSVATGRNLPSSIIKVGGFLSALLASLEADDVTLVKSDAALFLTEADPAKRFAKATKDFKSLVLLSATVNPSHLYLRSIGLDARSTKVHTASTGYKFRIRTVIDKSVTTRFKMRTTEMYSQIAQRVAAVADSVSGSVGVFLPSYAFLESIREPLLSEIGATQAVLVERPGLANQDADEMMSAFKSNRGSMLLAVQGGRFSEGEDFPGDGMDVSIIVGLSLPPPSPALYAEYGRMGPNKFDKHQAYMILSLLPALRKAFQCAGRHVRNPGKVGMVFFMDSRFANPKIVELMPSWLKEDLVKEEFQPESIRTVTREFFIGARGR